jgi:hypothetical protein
MPRLTHHTYCAQHRSLREVWLDDQPAWSELSANEQWDLHDFFSPTRELSAYELKEFRQKMTAADPSLPQRAGRALKKLELARAVRTSAAEARPAQPVSVDKPKRKYKSAERRISVKSLVHPEPNVERMAKALLALAREMAEVDRMKNLADDIDHDSAA